MDGFAPEDTLVLSQTVDGEAPESRLSAARIAGTDDYRVDWRVEDDNGGSGMRHVTLYVAEDGGDFRIWQRQLTHAEGSLIFAGEPGKSYEFLALATDVPGNRALPTPGVHSASARPDVTPRAPPPGKRQAA